MSELDVSSGLEPTGVLSHEPAEAQKLNWLPLAVRYKLDQCGLKVGLDQWRSLPLAARQELLAIREGDGFASLLFARLGSACERIEPKRAWNFQDYVQGKMKKHSKANTDRVAA